MEKYKTLLIIFFLFTVNSLFSQPDNTALGDVQVAAPEVASLAKFSEASNNHFTGAASISIPIEVLQEGNIQVPISVNHQASGVRVGDVSSRVGLNFSLSGSGVISRTILGIEDEDDNGYLNTNYDYNLQQVLTNVSLGLADGEPDLWSYSLPGGPSGKFIINKSINEIVQYPRTDVKIEVSGNDLEEFTITTPDGTKYLFGQAGNENYDGYIQVGELPQAFAPSEPKKANARNATGPRRQHTEWYLRKIVSYDDNYEINYTYTAKEYIMLSPASEQYSKVFSNRTTSDPGFLQAEQGFGEGSESVGSFNVLAANNGRTIHPLYASIQMFEPKELTSITTSTTRVDFIEGTSKRQDLDAAPYSDSEIANNLARPSYLMYPLAQIKVSGIGGSPYCKTVNFSYDYFKAFANPTHSFDVRLKLNSIQEVTCNGTGEIVNPYIFDYYTDDNLGFDFVSWRLTKERDAYGYYNAESINNSKKFTIPATILSASHGSSVVTLSHGEAKRQTEFEPMRYGSLKSVKYPEKGKTEFIYEANSIKRVTYDTTEVAGKFRPTLSNCALNSSSNTACCGTQYGYQIYNFDQGEIDSLLIRIYIQNVGCMSEPGVPYEGFVLLVVRDMVTGNLIGTLKEGNSTSLIDSITIDMKSAYPSMMAGRDYQFELEVTECRGFLFFRKKQINETVSNELVGGLRLAAQHSYDRSNNLLTSRFYDYSRKDEPGVSSGVVYKKPYFGQVISGGDITAVNSSGFSYNNFFVKFSWNSTPILSLTDIQGYHIGYQSIREYQSNGAFTDFVFKTRSLDSELGNTLLPYPIAPLQYFYDNGKPSSREQGGNDGSADFIVSHQGFHAGSFTQSISQNQAARVETESGEAGTLHLANRFNWQHSGFYRTFRDTIIKDGVRTVVHYAYPTFPPEHLQPTEITMTNSDGEVTVNKTRFSHEIVADGDLPNQSVYQEMIDRNMVAVPIEQTREIDGTLVSGTRSEFNIFHGDPYLEKVSQYETTWDTLGNEVQTGWELLGTIDEYYDFGKKKKLTRKHWSPMEYEYHPVHRLPTKKTFLNFEWNYAYHAGSRLISRITDIDGQYTDFRWDGLARVDSIISRLGAIKVDFTYKYAGQDVSRPQTYIQQKTTFTPVTGSDLQEQTVWSYFDDLSRPFQTVKQAYSADSGFDVVSAIEYDDYSRPYKQFEEFEIASSGGHSVVVPANTPFTLTTYEETSLNRPMSSTPPSWHTTIFEYGANTAADAVMNLRTGAAYTAGLLTKAVVIDPNLHKSIVFKDKRNRPVLNRKEGKTTVDRADTYSLFDAKERPFIIVPPAATLTTTPELIFKTFYDGANNPVFKKIPDMAIMEMRFNDRDLMIAQQRGNLRKDGKWIITQYDDYGRPEQTGLNSTPTTVNEVWTKSFYDGDQNVDLINAPNFINSGLLNFQNPKRNIGKLTASQAEVLNGNQLIGIRNISFFNYDDHGRVIFQPTRNHRGGWVITSSKYDFADNLTQADRIFYLSEPPNPEYKDTINNTYDHQARLIDSYHSMRDESRQHISRLAYTAKR